VGQGQSQGTPAPAALAPLAGGRDDRWSWISAEPYPLVVGGVPGPSRQGGTFEAVSPRDKSVIATICEAGLADVDDAVGRARAAFDDGPWAKLTARARARYLLRLAELLESNSEELAFIEGVDAGKPLSTVRQSDLAISLDALEFLAGQARTRSGRVAEMPDAEVVHHELQEPLGVVAEILPWNGPLWTGVQRLAAILAAGNCAIIKPAELASLVFVRFAQLMLELDLPPGVLSVLPGRGEVTGEALVCHPAVDMVSLTGGVETGRRVLELTARSAKRVSLELGGKNPNIVFADADLEHAVSWSAVGAFANSGQICVSGSRIHVQREVHDTFVDLLVHRAGALKVGDPLDPNTDLGPVIGEEHERKVWRYIEAGKEEAELVAGGRPYSDPERSVGAYIPPTVFTGATPSCRITREEIFGPVVTVLGFDSFDQAVKDANDTPYGLAAGIFTKDVDRAWAAARELRAGQVYVNQWFTPGVLEAPSRGYKASGYGEVGMRKYQQSKNVFFRTSLSPLRR
jgi:betaine-aldehyde dehydrogenase